MMSNTVQVLMYSFQPLVDPGPAPGDEKELTLTAISLSTPRT